MFSLLKDTAVSVHSAAVATTFNLLLPPSLPPSRPGTGPQSYHGTAKAGPIGLMQYSNEPQPQAQRHEQSTTTLPVTVSREAFLAYLGATGAAVTAWGAVARSSSAVAQSSKGKQVKKKTTVLGEVRLWGQVQL